VNPSKLAAVRWFGRIIYKPTASGISAVASVVSVSVIRVEPGRKQQGESKGAPCQNQNKPPFSVQSHKKKMPDPGLAVNPQKPVKP